MPQPKMKSAILDNVSPRFNHPRKGEHYYLDAN
jgi:hypothetical protein